MSTRTPSHREIARRRHVRLWSGIAALFAIVSAIAGYALTSSPSLPVTGLAAFGFAFAAIGCPAIACASVFIACEER